MPCIGLLWLLTPVMPHGPRGLIARCRLVQLRYDLRGRARRARRYPACQQTSEGTSSFVSMGGEAKGGKRWTWYSNMASLSCLVSPMADEQRVHDQAREMNCQFSCLPPVSVLKSDIGRAARKSIPTPSSPAGSLAAGIRGTKKRRAVAVPTFSRVVHLNLAHSEAEG